MAHLSLCAHKGSRSGGGIKLRWTHNSGKITRRERRKDVRIGFEIKERKRMDAA
jgi:hypothetical protein